MLFFHPWENGLKCTTVKMNDFLYFLRKHSVGILKKFSEKESLPYFCTTNQTQIRRAGKFY